MERVENGIGKKGRLGSISLLDHESKGMKEGLRLVTPDPTPQPGILTGFEMPTMVHQKPTNTNTNTNTNHGPFEMPTMAHEKQQIFTS